MDRKPASTTKKVKIIGNQQYINADTGEIEEFQVTSLQDRDFNFTKIWLNSVLQTLNLIGNRKSKVAYHIIDNLNKENQFIGTQRQIAETTGIGLNTVNETLKILVSNDFLRKITSSVYIVNPDLIFKGSRSSRLNVLNQYNTSESPKLSIEDKITNLEKLKVEIQKKINALTSLSFQQTTNEVNSKERSVS